jgi:hypothetical protein
VPPHSTGDGSWRCEPRAFTGALDTCARTEFFRDIARRLKPGGLLVNAGLDVTPAAVRKAKSRVLLRLRQELGDIIA